MGAVEGEPKTEGLHFFNPITKSMVEIDVREQKVDGQTTAFTRDTQNVEITYSITYYPDPTKIGQIYKQFGRDWDDKIVGQVVLGSMKDAVGQYVADDLVAKREVAKAAAQKEITDALADRGVIVTRIDFTNLDFSPAYEKAVEEKVEAIQHAQKAKNRTVEVEEQAKQTVLSAKASAEAMKIQTEALKQSKALVEYEAVKKWDGALPQYIFGGGAVPFIDIARLGKGSSVQ